jgi:membrane-bound serine protease (ClpP class)
VLEDLLNPTVVFTLFYVGLMLIGIEVLHPGISLPGVAGVLAMVGAFVGFGLLPVRMAGIVLLLASVGFFLIEAKNPGISVAAAGAIICLVAGGFLLIDPSVDDTEGVSPWAIVPIAISAVGFFTFMIPAALKARRLPSDMKIDNMVGSEGIVTRRLDPAGIVHVGAESWSAESTSGSIGKGTHVRVVGHKGVRLTVEPLPADELLTAEGG